MAKKTTINKEWRTIDEVIPKNENIVQFQKGKTFSIIVTDRNLYKLISGRIEVIKVDAVVD